MTVVHDLLDLPQAVRKGDFVQDQTGGIAQPERAVKNHAITEKIVQTLERALSSTSDRRGRTKAQVKMALKELEADGPVERLFGRPAGYVVPGGEE